MESKESGLAWIEMNSNGQFNIPTIHQSMLRSERHEAMDQGAASRIK
jgi:hypothetical protein